MKFPHHEIPLLKPLLLFIAGIIFAEYFKISIRISSLLLYLIIGLVAITIVKGRIHKFFHSIILSIICFSFGYILHHERTIRTATELIGEKTMSIRIDEISPHEKHKKCFGSVLSHLSNENQLINTNKKILVYFKGLSSDSSIVVGNEYLISGKSFPIQETTNPHAFDYAQYLDRKGVNMQLFVEKDQTKLLRKNQHSRLKQVIQSIRNHCLITLEKYFPDKDKLGILQAMVLGKRDGLEKDINQAFIDTGAIHVLAVSGLHVGILCLFISLLFKVLEPLFRLPKIYQGIISVLIIWIFAMITGGSPAVLRAALMFSLFYIATDIIHRQVSMYNVLSATGLILLVINPSQLFQVGFQFSFLAVLSIVFFFPYLKDAFVSRFRLANYLYTSVAIGIAAQVLVFPLSIFYFNQFANSFLISSLFVVQFAIIILVSGLILLLLEFAGLAIINEKLLVPILDFVLDAFKGLIHWVQELPYSVSENLWLDQVQMFLLYACIISGMFYLKQGRKFTYLGMVFLFLFLNYTVADTINKRKQHVAYIYDAKELCIDVIVGKRVFHLGNIERENAGFIYSRNRLSHSIDIDYDLSYNSYNSFEHRDGILRLGSKILAFANIETFDLIRKDQKIDYVLVTDGNTELMKLTVDQLCESEIIIDGSIKFWEIEKFLTYAEENGLNVYNIKTKGAKKIEF